MDPRSNQPSPPTQTRLRALVSAPRWVVDDTLAYRFVNASRFPLGHNGRRLWAIQASTSGGGELGEVPHVLLVDRDKLAAEVYQLGLEQAGIRVAMVADANSFSKAIEEPPDALVIEWEMLDVAGDEMLKQLALDARMAGRSVFVLINFISRVNDKTGTLSRELGATEWLVKSATAPDLLAAAILGALDHGRSPELAGSGERWCVSGFRRGRALPIGWRQNSVWPG